jgi:predicted GNAT family acetyltransferase
VTSASNSAESGDITVSNNEAARQYEVRIGDDVAFLRYQLEPGRIVLVHTEVPQSLSGRGIGGRLARFALDDARARELRVVPVCPFVRAYIERNPAYAELVDPGASPGTVHRTSPPA